MQSRRTVRRRSRGLPRRRHQNRPVAIIFLCGRSLADVADAMVLADDLTSDIETVVFAGVPALRARGVVVDGRSGRNFEHGLVEGAVDVADPQGSEDTGDVDGARVITVLAMRSSRAVPKESPVPVSSESAALSAHRGRHRRPCLNRRPSGFRRNWTETRRLPPCRHQPLAVLKKYFLFHRLSSLI